MTYTVLRNHLHVILRSPPEVLAERRRLAHVSWCMRCTADNIARRANLDDECTGRWWGGRYKLQLRLFPASLRRLLWLTINEQASSLRKQPHPWATIHEAAKLNVRSICPMPDAWIAIRSAESLLKVDLMRFSPLRRCIVCCMFPVPSLQCRSFTSLGTPTAASTKRLK